MSEETEITVEEAPAAETPKAKSPAKAGGKKSKAAAPAPEKTVAASLKEQLGGDEAIQNAVDILTEKLMADPRVNYFLFGVSRADQGDKHKSFLTVALRGEGEETADQPDLRKTFADFLDKGFKDDHLRDALKQMDITDELSEAVIKASNGIRQSLFTK
jgi:hemoglobin